MANNLSLPSDDNRASILKNYFSKYLIDIKGLKESTVNHYLDALNNISRHLKNKDLVQKDIYDITDIDYLTKIKSMLSLDPDFMEQDKRGHQMYSAGLNNYVRFANGKEFEKIKDDVIKLDMPMAPEEPVIVKQTVWKRSDILRLQALSMADYCCEINGTHESFISEQTKKPYMEGHHAIPMKHQSEFKNSLDVYANIICLCPICHRKIHFGLQSERLYMIHKLYDDRSNRLKQSGIDLSRKDFTEIILS